MTASSRGGAKCFPSLTSSKGCQVSRRYHGEGHKHLDTVAARVVSGFGEVAKVIMLMSSKVQIGSSGSLKNFIRKGHAKPELQLV